MAVKKKVFGNIISQEESGNGLLSGEGVEKIGADLGAEEMISPAEQTLEEFAADLYPDLRSHTQDYVATQKKGREALVSVCYAKTGKRVTVSVKQAKKLLNYGANDWLDVKYSDSTHTVLIGKSLNASGILPRFTEKKYIIYDISTVTDFAETLQLDFSTCSSHSAYSYQMVELEGRPFIALTPADFV